MEKRRLIYLECARGIAAIIVMFHHFSLAFFPNLKSGFWRGGLHYTPAYMLVNGDGAISFFFVLSGFVLTIKLYHYFTWEEWGASVLKRLPRLVVPAGASILLGFLVLRFGGGSYLAASHLDHSAWLASFGEAPSKAGWHPTLSDALKQSVLVFLLPAHFFYNSNLWTMPSEFYGSMLVFAVTPLGMLARRRRFMIITMVHALFAALFALSPHPLIHSFVAFVIGSYCAYLWTQRRSEMRLSSRATGALIIAIVVGFSVSDWHLNTLASTALLVTLLGNARLSALLSGRVGALLGTASFPFYLVHTLVILSVSSATFTTLIALGLPMPAVGALTLLMTAIVSAGAAVPFIFLDRYWTAGLNRFVAVAVMPALDAGTSRRQSVRIRRRFR